MRAPATLTQMLRLAITDRRFFLPPAAIDPEPSTSAPPSPGPSLSGASLSEPSLSPLAPARVALDGLVAHCGRLAQDGIDFLLIREKDLHAAELMRLCRALRPAVPGRPPNPQTVVTAPTATRILVASRPDIAIAANLDGVQLSAHPHELTPAQVRLLYERAGLPQPFVTLSCHTSAEVRRARLAGASAVLFAPVFGKAVFGNLVSGTVSGRIEQGREVTPPAGLEALRAAVAEAESIPVFALGGVTAANAAECLQAGAAGVAGIRLFMGPPTGWSSL